MNANAKKGPSLNPQRMRDGSWYYEDRRRIEVYAETNVGHLTRAHIPFGRLIRSLERCGYTVTKRPD